MGYHPWRDPTRRSIIMGQWIKASAIVAAIIAIYPSPSQAARVDLAATTITLERSACYGSCPVYSLTIHGDGRVRFSSGLDVQIDDPFHRAGAGTIGNVAMPGVHEAKIPVADVAGLLKKFDQAGFLNLRDEYRAQVTDMPTQVITLVVGDRRKTVVDYAGMDVGMPAAVQALEQEVDRVAGSDRWVKANVSSLAWLDASGFDVRSPKAAVLAMNAEAHEGDEAFVVALVDRGMPLDILAAPDPYQSESEDPEPEVVGTALLRSAIARGHATVFNRLVARGWLRRAGVESMAQVFARRAAGCSPALVDAAASAGMPVDAVTREDPTQAGSAGETALSNLSNGWMCKDEIARKATEARLRAHGADPRHIEPVASGHGE
jgi:hypothetical protein